MGMSTEKSNLKPYNISSNKIYYLNTNELLNYNLINSNKLKRNMNKHSFIEEYFQIYKIKTKNIFKNAIINISTCSTDLQKRYNCNYRISLDTNVSIRNKFVWEHENYINIIFENNKTYKDTVLYNNELIFYDNNLKIKYLF